MVKTTRIDKMTRVDKESRGYAIGWNKVPGRLTQNLAVPGYKQEEPESVREEVVKERVITQREFEIIKKKIAVIAKTDRAKAKAMLLRVKSLLEK